jgi:hypothetical protein
MRVLQSLLGRLVLLTVAIATFELWEATNPGRAQTASSRIDEALQNITALVRSGRVGYATFWDGNKYIQCRRMPERGLRCEAAGTSMQPSLRNALTGDRLARLATLGWALDLSFGNYARTFSAETPTNRVADQILQTLTEAYGAEPANLEVQTEWVADVACPPRNGPSQNLAGLISDAPSMRKSALRACSYAPDWQTPQMARSSAELIAIYGATTTAEIQRLRINAGRNVYVSFNAGIGYVQCMPETPPAAMYCEAQSAESWPALATILTDERVSRLRNYGYADPGRAPNFWKSYPLDKFNDAAIAGELLTILHEVYGYTGATKLKILTE